MFPESALRRRHPLAVALLLPLLLPLVDGATILQGEPVGPQAGSFVPDSHLMLTAGMLQVSITDPQFSDIVFTAEARSVGEAPRALLVESSPLGPFAIIEADPTSGPDYWLELRQLGVTLPLDGLVGLPAASLQLGATHFTVVQAPPVQDPQPGDVSIQVQDNHKKKPGWRIIYFGVPGANITFRQFSTTRVYWSGLRITREGSVEIVENEEFRGELRETGNNGQPMVTGGARTYVDSALSLTGANTPPSMNPTADGDYPSISAYGDTYAADGPNVLSRDFVEGEIEASEGGNSIEVRSLTYEKYFTLYVFRNGNIILKIRWHSTETVTTDGMDYPNGDFGGPAAGEIPDIDGPGVPSVEAANAMEPQHTAAHAAYMQGNYGGAPTPNGY